MLYTIRMLSSLSLPHMCIVRLCSLETLNTLLFSDSVLFMKLFISIYRYNLSFFMKRGFGNKPYCYCSYALLVVYGWYKNVCKNTWKDTILCRELPHPSSDFHFLYIRLFIIFFRKSPPFSILSTHICNSCMSRIL